ncbi:MAG: hypothetical protein Q8Q96_00485 [bacterium]|nr:hypothetical protein [bacterium]
MEDRPQTKPEALPAQSTFIYMLDVDGVVTNPETKKPNPRILAFIANSLLYNSRIAMATTRDYAWLEEFVISPIRPYLSPDKMDNLFVSCEKAAVSVSFKNGQMRKKIDTSAVVPDILRKLIKEGLEKQNKTGVFNYPKEAVHTVEINGGDNEEETAQQQYELDEFDRWLQTEIMPRFPDFKADRTAIAVDIYHKSGNKMKSAQQFVEFLKEQGVELNDKHFIAIGDGKTDMEMAVGLRDSGQKVFFGWVGKGIPPTEEGIETITPGTRSVNDQATVDLLAYLGEFSAFSRN